VTTMLEAKVFRLDRDAFLRVLRQAARNDGRADGAALAGAGLLV